MKHIVTFSVCLAAILVSCTRIQETNVDFGSKTFVNEYKTLTDAVNDLRVAVTNQTTSLELKLAAIEAAIQAQTVEVKAGDELIRTAIETLDASVKAGIVSEQEALEQIKAAMDSQTSTLSTKLSAIEAAITIGFADIVTAEGLVSSAISSLSANVKTGFITEKQALDQIKQAVQSQTFALSTNLMLIKSSVDFGLMNVTVAEQMVKDEVYALKTSVDVGNVTEMYALDQIKQAVNSQTFTLSYNLMLIKSSIDSGLMNVTEAEKLVKDAVYALKASVDNGNFTEMYALDQIKQAVNSQTFTLSYNLMLIKYSIDFGLMNVTDAEKLVEDALVCFMGSNDQKLGQIITSLGELKDQSDENTKKITNILEKTAYDNGIIIPNDFPNKILMTKNAYESMKSASTILGSDKCCDTEKALLDNLNYNVDTPTTDQRKYSDYPNGSATGHACFTASKTSEAPAEIIGQMTGDCYEVYKTREWVEYKFELSSGCTWPYLRKIEIEDANGKRVTDYNKNSKGGTWTGIKVYHYIKDSNGDITTLCKKPRASAWCES